jgi:hypothetical protein
LDQTRRNNPFGHGAQILARLLLIPPFAGESKSKSNLLVAPALSRSFILEHTQLSFFFLLSSIFNTLFSITLAPDQPLTVSTTSTFLRIAQFHRLFSLRPLTPDNMFAKSTLLFAVFSIAAQLVAATPNACLLKAIKYALEMGNARSG